MGSASRRKGLAGEREVADLFRAHGFEVRGLEGEGDHLCIALPPPADLELPGGVIAPALGRVRSPMPPIFSEVKRRETLQIWQHLAQLEAEAPPGTLPLLSFRRNRSAWYGCAPLEALVKVLA